MILKSTMTEGIHFYKKGLRFQCQGDGKCCVTRGKYGYVYLSFNDRKRIATHLGMSADAFTDKFTRKVDGLYELRYTGRDCPFLNDRQCRIYAARPWQCRTWPFWPENMNNEVWEQEVATWCPGVGKGRLYTSDEISEILHRKKDVSGYMNP
jgi:Fe-S-cluster containining protein